MKRDPLTLSVQARKDLIGQGMMDEFRHSQLQFEEITDQHITLLAGRIQYSLAPFPTADGTWTGQRILRNLDVTATDNISFWVRLPDAE